MIWNFKLLHFIRRQLVVIIILFKDFASYSFLVEQVFQKSPFPEFKHPLCRCLYFGKTFWKIYGWNLLINLGWRQIHIPKAFFQRLKFQSLFKIGKKAIAIYFNFYYCFRNSTTLGLPHRNLTFTFITLCIKWLIDSVYLFCRTATF